MKLTTTPLFLIAALFFNAPATAAEFTSIASCKFEGFPIMVLKFRPDGYEHKIQIGESKELKLNMGAGSSPMITASDGPAHYSFNLRIPYSIGVQYDGASNAIARDGECVFTQIQ